MRGTELHSDPASLTRAHDPPVCHPGRRQPGPSRPWRLLAAAVPLCTLLLQAAPTSEAFDRANRLYEQGQYADAIQAYEAVLAAGQASPAVYFNLGNACFKSGQVGRAIVSFRRAEQQAPRDPDIRANLQFARNAVPGANTPAPPRWQRWLPRLTLDEGALVSAASLWLWLGLLAVRQLWPRTEKRLRRLSVLAGATAVLLIAGTAAIWHERRARSTAVVIQPEVAVHFGPLEESQRAFSARDGMELPVTDRQGDWLQVTDASRRVGWLKRPQISLLP